MNDIIRLHCDKNIRADIFISQELGYSRSQVNIAIESGFVSVDDRVILKSGHKLKPDQNITITLPKPKQSEKIEVDFDVEVLYEDSEILVINKPSSLVVHSAPSVKKATLVDWLKSKGISLSTLGSSQRHGIVHRLDKGTSGVMIVAKTNEAHTFLSSQLQDRTMGRFYICVTNPPLKDGKITVEKRVARNPKNRLKMTTFDDVGRDAKTDFVPLAISLDEKLSLVACKLYSGRTHQIRVHLESINRHIVGDELYALGVSKEKSERILLHAYMIYFIHPATKKMLYFVAKPDSYMLEYINNRFDKEGIENVFKTFNTWECLSDIF